MNHFNLCLQIGIRLTMTLPQLTLQFPEEEDEYVIQMLVLLAFVLSVPGDKNEPTITSLRVCVLVA